MAITCGSATGQPYSQINMTPLIDVLLVLLIIFIITLPSQTHAIRIDNPSPSPLQRVARPLPINLQIDFDGALLWNKLSIDRVALRTHIDIEARKSPQPEVRITVDKFARYEVVAQTLAELQRGGLKAVGFVNGELFQQ